jgi:hypothetical protein
MRSLIDGVCIKLLTRLRHNQSSARNPKSESSMPCARAARPEGAAREQGLQFSLYSQAKKTCDYYDHDHHTDDVKDVHRVLLRVRDAICLRDGRSAIGAPRLVLSWAKRCWSNHALIDQRKSV